MKYAPIILFAYNRPGPLLRTLESLSSNKEASESNLFVFCDGPKQNATASDLEQIKQVRALVNSRKWCKTVTVREQEVNKGLADSVITGVSEVLETHDKVIVVEDDVLLSPHFLGFMNQALIRYQNNEKVLSVGSWNYFCKPSFIKLESFFFRYPDSIAWGTFSRAWKLLEQNSTEALAKLEKNNLLQKFNGDGQALYFEKMLRMHIEGKINSWAIRWTATAVLNNMLTLYPAYSLSKHIGFGNDSTHEKSEEDYNKQLKLAAFPVKIDNVEVPVESQIALQQWKYFVNKNFIKKEPGSGYFRQKLSAAKTKMYRLTKKIIHSDTEKSMSEAGQLIIKAQKFPRYKETSFNYKDLNFTVSDFLSVSYQVAEYFEEERMKFNSHTEHPFIIDCGSNVGVSVLYFKKLYPSASILAFEADPEIFGYLKNNLKNNNASDVRLFNSAVWIHSDGVAFGSEGADGGSVHFSGAKLNIPSVRLKDIIADQPTVDLLKMDIEGAEVEVLSDCGSSLKKIKNLFVEYHSWTKNDQQLDKLLAVLHNNGFRYYIHSIGKQSKQPFVSIDDYNGMDGQLDIYAVNTHAF